MHYQDGWYEIPHEPPEYDGIPITLYDNQWAWKPRQDWCRATFAEDTWEMRDPIYTYSEGPNGPDKRVISTVPLTWRFRQERDATLYILRWGR